MLDKDKIYEKWKPILDSINVDDENKKNWLSEYAFLQSLTDFQTQVYSGNTTGLPSYYGGDYDWSKPLLPIAMRVYAHTLGGVAGKNLKNNKQKKID